MQGEVKVWREEVDNWPQGACQVYAQVRKFGVRPSGVENAEESDIGRQGVRY